MAYTFRVERTQILAPKSACEDSKAMDKLSCPASPEGRSVTAQKISLPLGTVSPTRLAIMHLALLPLGFCSCLSSPFGSKEGRNMTSKWIIAPLDHWISYKKEVRDEDEFAKRKKSAASQSLRSHDRIQLTVMINSLVPRGSPRSAPACPGHKAGLFLPASRQGGAYWLNYQTPNALTSLAPSRDESLDPRRIKNFEIENFKHHLFVDSVSKLKIQYHLHWMNFSSAPNHANLWKPCFKKLRWSSSLFWWQLSNQKQEIGNCALAPHFPSYRGTPKAMTFPGWKRLNK